MRTYLIILMTFLMLIFAPGYGNAFTKNDDGTYTYTAEEVINIKRALDIKDEKIRMMNEQIQVLNQQLTENKNLNTIELEEKLKLRDDQIVKVTTDFTSVIAIQEQQLKNKDDQISLYKLNENNYSQIISIKNDEISDLKRNNIMNIILVGLAAYLVGNNN